MSEVHVLRLDIADARARAVAFCALTLPLARTNSAPEPMSDEDNLDQAFARGIALGRATAEQNFAIERAALQTLLASAQALQPEPSDELAALIVETVSRLVETITGTTEIDRETLNARAHRAAALIADADMARTLHLHPDDIALIDAAAIPLSIVADPALIRGSLRIACSTGWIEDGVATRLDALRDLLGEEEDRT